MKINLLSNGGYNAELSNVKFPKMVEAEQLNGSSRMYVKGCEFGLSKDETFIFIDGEYEIDNE